MAMSKEQGEQVWLSRWSDWVRMASEKHGGRYTYPGAVRVDGKVRIVCPDHGEFLQAGNKHMHGQGCPKCVGKGSDKLASLKSHYPDWDWSSVTVSKTKERFKMTCPEHGEFETLVNRLLNRKNGLSPCPKCNKVAGGTSNRVKHDEWVKRIAKVWGDKYTLNESAGRCQDKVEVLCAAHGPFAARLLDLVNGHGCPSCGNDRGIKWNDENIRVPVEVFVKRAQDLKGSKYTYDISTFVDMKTPMRMECDTHGEFWQIPRNHITLDAGCPYCANSVSKGEAAICKYLEELGLKVKSRDRAVLGGKEIDILLPDLKIGVEYCGLYWHGESNLEASYHQEKHDAAKAQGYKLIQIFEDEWSKNQEKVKFQLLNLVGACQNTHARRTTAEVLAWKEAEEFLETWHLSGPGKPSAMCYGLRHQGVLVAVATWGSDRFSKEDGVELYRLAFAGGVRVVGGVSKLLKAMLRDHPETRRVLTYADLRWGTGEGYEAAGFKYVGRTDPGYFWCKGLSRWNRQMFQKHKLKDILSTFDESKTGVENCHANGYWRIYDAGSAKYEIRL